jgi:hypothetical protein
MRPLRTARTAWTLAAASLAILASGFAVQPDFAAGWVVPISAAFALVGALIAARRPENPVGWLLLGFGVVAAIEFAALHYADRALVADPGSLPGGDIAASVAAHVWHAGWGLFVFSFLVFPEGRLLSPRWRWVARTTVVVYGGLVVSGIFESSYLESPDADVPGATAIFHGAVARVGSAVFGVLLITNLLLLVVAAASLLLRLRRARGDERQQVKWFVLTVAFVLLSFPVTLVVFGDAVGVLLFPLIPVAAAVAILKYRLYDIDVVVNRTLVYGALTATLALAYLGSVLVLQLALSWLTHDSGLVVAASTLAVAALFRPARAQIQSAVDRRFYRRRYDAQRTVDAFAARLRDEVDLGALDVELSAAVRETLQPAHMSLWLREARR